MTDYDRFLHERIDGVRGMWEIDVSNTTIDAVVDGVIFINNDVNIVVLPTHADDVVHLDIHGFIDGEQIATDSFTVRRDN